MIVTTRSICVCVCVCVGGGGGGGVIIVTPLVVGKFYFGDHTLVTFSH